MITYIKAKNFKSLKNIEFNLKRTQSDTNKFISIYGENGSGKTNIVELFKFLQQLTISRSIDVQLTNFPKEFFDLKDLIIDNTPTEMKNLWELSLNLKDYQMLNEDNPTEIEYGFNINNIEGYYFIKFKENIIEENLYYLVDKQKGTYFHLEKNENKIIKKLNTTIFKNENYNEELKENIDKYWGKYSFLSLLTFELSEKNKEYILNNINSKIFDIINKILSMTVHVNKWYLKLIPDNIFKQSNLQDLKSGTIKKDNIFELKKYENILNIFFTQSYADIKSVTYKIEEKNDILKYKLYFKKMIGGKLKTIPIELESDGTKRIVEQFDTLIGALMGKTVVIDEIDNGIHDLLMKNIILSIKDELTGQLIITTHNTLLLEVLPKDNIYILSTDYEGNKEINSIKNYGINIQKNHNARDLYFKGLFGGIPTTSYVDFEEIKYALEDYKTKDNLNDKKT